MNPVWAVSVSVHRRLRALATLLLLLTVALVAVLGNGATKSPGPVFVRDPYMGMSCPRADSTACDRVGLAVWLARPAAVTAAIHGSVFRLDDPSWSYVSRQGRNPPYVYAGFLRPAGLGSRLQVGATPLVCFRVEFGHGDVVTTQQHVWLNAGCG